MNGRESFALSTYRSAKEFHQGVEELHTLIPVAAAREYLITGRRREEYSPAAYDRVDELQALRRRAIQGEMRYGLVQVERFLRDHPDIAAQAARERGQETITAREYLGEGVADGDSLVFVLDPALCEACPSIQVVELFIWWSMEELERRRAELR